MSVKIYTGRVSDGAKALSEATGYKRLKSVGSTWRPRAGDTVINWGCSSIPNFSPATVLNAAESVKRAANKWFFFEDCLQKGSPFRTPEFTSVKDQAARWIAEGSKVVCRKVLTGHSGAGIIIAETVEELVDAPLYTRYVKKSAEYRVHVVRGKVVDLQRKIRDPDREPIDWQVRSHQNGFIYVRDGVHAPGDVEVQALAAFNASGLDFGGVDVVFNEREQKAYVLEINTAVGLQGQTVQSYADAFKELIG